eukprot:NODE_26_length_35450_cov_0.398320.p21 type:complete len:162 gc:universal NODE_26_length_35450_cov_0.398320:17102-16617(-)
MTTRTKEPKCCCCGVRVGLGILFFLSLVFGIIDFVFGSFGQGTCMVVGGIIGLFAVIKKSSAATVLALVLFIITQMISIALSIYAMTALKPFIISEFPYQKDDNSVTLSDEEVDKLRASSTTSAYAVYGISLAVSVIFTILISERMITYRKWLKTKRNTFE